MTGQNAPTVIDDSTITITATTATDTGGVEYYFENETIADGSHDSGLAVKFIVNKGKQ